MGKAYLVLQNGSVYEGQSFGAVAEAVGEVVFTTGMVGYHDTLTDKSYSGQIVVQTFPLIGNYGIIKDNFEGDRAVPVAYVVKEYCCEPSNFRSEGTIENYLKEQGVPGIFGIDTRALTKEIRENGVMNAKLVYSKEDADKAAKDVNGELKNYSVKAPVKFDGASYGITVPAEGEKKVTVALIDLGAKKSVIKALTKRGCDVRVCSPDVTAETIKNCGADGVLVSEGPGNPEDYLDVINNLKDIVKLGLPVYAIGLGHQVLALANGFKTAKMKFGHRGASQPVKEIATGRIYITAQNHGYEVIADSVNAEIAEVNLININDKSCEGIAYKNAVAKSVQFCPDAFGGALDTSWFYDEFVTVMGGN